MMTTSKVQYCSCPIEDYRDYPTGDTCPVCGKNVHHERRNAKPAVRDAPLVRTFDTGATRDTDANKLDFEGFLSPVVLERYSEYMHKHRIQPDGALRDSDNWQKGIPKTAYMKSAFRHFFDWWMAHRGFASRDGIEEAVCALLFNAMGYLSVLLTERRYRAAEAPK